MPKFAYYHEMAKAATPKLLPRIANYMKYKNYIFWPTVVNASKCEEINRKKCRQLWQRIDINKKGEIFICCGNCGNHPCLPHVNIYTSTVKEIYNHPSVTELRKNLLDKSMPVSAICQNCNLLYTAGW